MHRLKKHLPPIYQCYQKRNQRNIFTFLNYIISKLYRTEEEQIFSHGFILLSSSLFSLYYYAQGSLFLIKAFLLYIVRRKTSVKK